jgi:hypothetical protein
MGTPLPQSLFTLEHRGTAFSQARNGTGGMGSSKASPPPEDLHRKADIFL